MSRFGQKPQEPPNIIRSSAQKVQETAINLEMLPSKQHLTSVGSLNMVTFQQAFKLKRQFTPRVTQS
jgi:hypothetical protein